MWFQSLGRNDSPEKGMATHASILAARSLTGYSPLGRKKSDTAGAMSTHIQSIEPIARDKTNSLWLSIMEMLDFLTLWSLIRLKY